MCEVHHGIGSSKESPKEHFERNPHVSEDKVKGKKVSGVDWTNTGRRMKENKTLKASTALLLIEDRTCRNQ